MIAQPTNCPQLEGSSNQQKIGENWMIVEPTKSAPNTKILVINKE